MLWVSASMPVAAVTCGGSASVSSGSANTIFASTLGLNTMRFRCVSSSLITAERPTSEPVPEVVGSATKYGRSLVDGPHLRVVPHVLEDVALVRGGDADHLGHVERRAAAEADHAIGAMRLEGGRARHHLAGGRVAEHAGEHGHLQPRQMGLELGQHRQRGQRLVGDDQRALEALLAQVLRHFLARAGAEVDGGGKGKAADAHDAGCAFR